MKLIHSTPDFFAHDGRAAAKRGEGFGCFCAECGREVSAPFGYERRLVWCLYCGMEKGHVLAIDCPFGHHRFTFGITREEAVEEREWLKVSFAYFERMAEQRARRLGHVIDLFG